MTLSETQPNSPQESQRSAARVVMNAQFLEVAGPVSVMGSATAQAEPARQDESRADESRTDEPQPTPATPPANGPGTATAVRPAPARPAPDVLPPWRVILHNDDHNDMDHVVESIIRVIRLNRPSATRCTIEAHRKGCCQVVATHRERAEFLAEQLQSCRLTVTIEPVR